MFLLLREEGRISLVIRDTDPYVALPAPLVPLLSLEALTPSSRRLVVRLTSLFQLLRDSKPTRVAPLNAWNLVDSSP